MSHDLAPLDAPDPESHLVQSLRRMAGARDEADAFTVSWRGVAVEVSYTSGSGSSLSLRVRYPSVPTGTALTGHLRAIRPMAIELRPERDDDRAAKRKGVSVEAQTGDAAFDAEVYIDTPTAPDTARRVLASPEARAAALELLRTGVSDLVLDDAEHAIHVRVFATAHFEAWGRHPTRLLDLLAAIAAHVPPVEAIFGRYHDAAPSVANGSLALAGVVGGVLAGLCMFALLPGVCRGSCDSEGCELLVTNDPLCWQPHALGLTLAAVMWLTAQLTLARRFRGRSDSHRARATFALVSLFAAVPAGAVCGMVLVWWGR